MENASVEFDLKTLRPTYRLSIGIPGKSNAFAISRRLGLSEDIIEQAQQLLSSEHLQVEDMIGEMETNRRQAERDRAAAENLRREQEELRATYERKLQELEAKRTELLDQARLMPSACWRKPSQKSMPSLGRYAAWDGKSWKQM